jgi:hypothetical protein
MDRLNNHKWGGSGIEYITFEYILKNIPKGSKVIELGSGHCSTPALSWFYELYSIEHNPEFANIYPNVNYLVADNASGWYNRDAVKAFIPKDHTFVLIDGTHRAGILKNLDIFNPDAVYMIHDTYRPDEIQLAHDLGKALGRVPVFHDKGDYFAII